MTPQQKKADELVERFRKYAKIGTDSPVTGRTENAIQCAIICVKEMIAELLADHETVIQHLRKDIETCEEEIKDAATTDFLTGVMEQHETFAWILRRYLS